MHFLTVLFLAIALSFQTAALAESKLIPRQPVLTQALEPVISLPDVVRKTMALHFGQSDKYKSLDELAHSFDITKNYRRPAGIFVTLSRKGKTRACWGSINPQYADLVTGTIYTTEAALSKEYRFKKIKFDEWQLLKPQVTIVKEVQPIQSMSDQNPMQFGLMVRSATKAAVILPGEASDAHYQLVICKLKAGISSTQPCQLYRIKADVFK